ncbi:MAG: glycosyltransferase family 2 protein [Dehalococcoidia bacterium]|nr:glycosyltransferase family 2 protein [Dehalococcoidia bacterium]
MNTRPLVTIGLPFYNSEDTLVAALKSVFAQTVDDWELIMVNDGGTDGSPEIAQAVNDPRVRVVDNRDNRKLAYRLNEIAQMARGKYLFRMDADDLLHSQRVEKQSTFLEEHPDVDVVDTARYTIDDEYNLIGVRGLAEIRKEPAQVLRAAPLIHATIAGPTQWFRDNPYDPTFPRSQDRDLWCRSAAHSNFGRIQEPLYFVREFGIHSTRRYLMHGHSNRRIFRKYGPEVVGWWKTRLLIAESHLKCGAYVVASVLGFEDRLIERRSIPLSDDLKQAGERELQMLLTVELPLRAGTDLK